jgi:hypothetical protein
MLMWMMEEVSRYADVDDGRYADVDDGGREQVH